MDQKIIRNSIATTRVTKAVNKDSKLINFLDSSEARRAKKEVEGGKAEKIGNLKDMDKWMDNL